MTPLRVLPEAEREIEEALRWFHEIDPVLATAFKLDLDRALARALHQPLAWPLHLRGTRRVLFDRFRYAVVYRARDDELLVVAVMHQSRRPGYWRGRRS